MAIPDRLHRAVSKNLGLVGSISRTTRSRQHYPMLIPAADVLAPQDSMLAKWGITEVPNDAEVDEYVGYMNAQLVDKLGEIVTYVPEKLDGERGNVRTKPTNLSRLITRAMTRRVVLTSPSPTAVASVPR